MMAGRGTVGRLADLALAVPTCTLVATKRVIPVAVRVGSVGTTRLIGGFSEALHQRRTTRKPAVIAPTVTAIDGAPDARLGLDFVEPDTSVGYTADDLAIEGYDALAARQVVDRLASLSADELVAVARYEREHRHRSTVLGKIEALNP